MPTIHPLPELMSVDPTLPIDAFAQKQFSEIRALFTNSLLCLNLLEALENQLKNQFESLSIELPEINKKAIIGTGLFAWPNPEEWRGPKAKGVLNQLLLKKERQYGINTHPYAPAFFSGFVPPQDGNKFVSELNLFKEFKRTSPSLHGMETHRLQWHLIILAAERGTIFTYITPDDITKLIQASVRIHNGYIFWPTIFDNYPENQQMIHLIGASCPHYLHSLIMLSNLHYLSACLFEAYTKNLAFLAQKAGHTSSANELLLEDLHRAHSFVPIEQSQLPTTYYSNEQLEFYSPTASSSESPGTNAHCIFYKKPTKPLISEDNIESDEQAPALLSS